MNDETHPQGKTHKILLPIIGLSLITILIIVGVSVLSLAYLDKDSRHVTSANKKCAVKQHKDYQVVVKNSTAMPDHTDANLCDTLTIVNKDNAIRLMAFGPHEDHVAYDGITEETLGQGQSLTVVLTQRGSFTFHDHISDKAQGSFTVD